jgi:ComF family protein
MGILDLVFPKTCLGCGKEGSYICSDCIAKLNYARPICAYCYKPSVDGLTHARCRKVFGLDGLVSIWEYEGIIRKAILSFKYKYATEIGKEFQDYISVRLKNVVLPRVECLVPIPIHRHKENVRGFNQSVLVGQEIAEEMGWNFESGLLIKKKRTVSQTELSGEKRRLNLRGAFAISQLNSAFKIPDSIVLFDDVFTTGSTIKEAARVLKKAGVSKVWGLTIAR